MSYTNLVYHIVYGTKDRLPLITKELRPRLHRYLGGMVSNLHGTPIEINGMADHVHVLARIKPVISIAEFLSKFKSISSGWARRQTRGKFKWQEIWRLHGKSISGRTGTTLHSQSGNQSLKNDARGRV